MDESIPVSRIHSSSFRPALAGVTLSLLVVPLNFSMIAVALPAIMRDFRVGVGGTGWLVASYLVTRVVLQLPAGRIGDRWGRRSTVLGGLAGSRIASLIGSLAPTLVILLVARIQQGIAGVFLATNSLALAYEMAESINPCCFARSTTAKVPVIIRERLRAQRRAAPLSSTAIHLGGEGIR